MAAVFAKALAASSVLAQRNNGGSSSSNSSSSSPKWYAPDSTNINSLAFAVNGTGAPGIFNSSYTPDSQYGTYVRSLTPPFSCRD